MPKRNSRLTMSRYATISSMPNMPAIETTGIYFYYNLKKKQQQEKRYIPVVSIAGIRHIWYLQKKA